MSRKITKPIKVCMVVNQIYHTDTRVISYANALIEEDAEVHIISARQENSASRYPKPGVTIFPIPLAKNNNSGLGYFINYILSVIVFTIFAFFLHLRHKYNVIHIHNMPDTLIFAALLPKFLGAKVILDIHDPMPNMFMSKFHKGADSRLVKFLKFQERFAAQLANEVITANPIFKEELSARGIPENKITVINNIPSPMIFDRQKAQTSIQPTNDNFTLIYPGTLASRYSLDIPIRALPALIEKIPNIQLKIIGKKNDYSDELSILASKLNVTSYVHFTSHLPANQVALEIAKADIGIYSAIPDAHMNIAMPGKVLEYVMMGIPVIASRLRILEAFFDDDSMLFFPPGNIEEFANLIIKLYNDQSLKENLIKNADEIFTKKYTWEKEFSEYLEMIENLTIERKK